MEQLSGRPWLLTIGRSQATSQIDLRWKFQGLTRQTLPKSVHINPRTPQQVRGRAGADIVRLEGARGCPGTLVDDTAPCQARECTPLTKFELSLANFGPIWRTSARFGPEWRWTPVGVGPDSIEFGLNLAEFGRAWAKVGRSRPNLGPNRPSFGRYRPSLADVGRD